MQDVGRHEYGTKRLKHLLEDFLPDEKQFLEVRQTFPLTPKHLDHHPEFHLSDLKAKQMMHHHQQRTQNLLNLCRDLKKRFQTFLFLCWNLIFPCFVACILNAGLLLPLRRSDEMNEWLSEVAAEYQQTPMDSVSPQDKESLPMFLKDKSK